MNRESSQVKWDPLADEDLYVQITAIVFHQPTGLYGVAGDPDAAIAVKVAKERLLKKLEEAGGG